MRPFRRFQLIGRIFWGKAVDERSAYFVAVSRAKQQLILTVVLNRERPADFPAHRPWSVSRQPHAEFLGYALQYQ